jgi:DNA-binding CsgD family transcriptional regulator
MRANRPTSAVEPPKHRRAASDPSHAPSFWLHDVLEHLEQALIQASESALAENAILLDREIGGARYVLLRAPSRTREGASLSPREQEIVRMVAAGHPNKVIADILEISSWTVSTHLRRIFAKLGVASRAAMVAKILNDAPLTQARSDVGPLSLLRGARG